MVTTQFISRAYAESILETMQPQESLLVCCTGFDTAAQSASNRITLKKIPKMLEHRCEFGQDDYSFNIVNLPFDAEERAAFQPDVSDDFVVETNEKATKKQETQQKLF
jgi:adenine-specific DNA-methyltransferase